MPPFNTFNFFFGGGRDNSCQSAYESQLVLTTFIKSIISAHIKNDKSFPKIRMYYF